MSKAKYSAKKIPNRMGGWSVFDAAGRLIGAGVGEDAKAATQDCLRSQIRELMDDLKAIEKDELRVEDWSKD